MFSYGPSYQKAPQAIDAEAALKVTLEEWETWAEAGCSLRQIL